MLDKWIEIDPSILEEPKGFLVREYKFSHNLPMCGHSFFGSIVRILNGTYGIDPDFVRVTIPHLVRGPYSFDYKIRCPGCFKEYEFRKYRVIGDLLTPSPYCRGCQSKHYSKARCSQPQWKRYEELFNNTMKSAGAVLLDPVGYVGKGVYKFRCKCGREDSRRSDQIYKYPCCKICARDRTRGPLNHMWNPNLTDEDRLAAKYGRGDEFKRWSRSVLERDHFTCQISGKSCELEAHHISPWAADVGARFSLENGIAMSKVLHKIFHSEEFYGKHNNTAEQVEEFRVLYRSWFLTEALINEVKIKQGNRSKRHSRSRGSDGGGQS